MPAGRPRSEAARQAILSATRDVLAARGFDKLTIELVSTAAGVAKQTVYRWYPSKNALVADSLLQGFVFTPSVSLTVGDSARDDIASWVHEFARVTADPQALALIRAASAASAEDPAIARGFQAQMKTQTRDAISARLVDGVESGQLRPGTPAGTVAEVLVGSLIYRLFTHDELTPEFVDELIDVVFAGIEVTSDE